MQHRMKWALALVVGLSMGCEEKAPEAGQTTETETTVETETTAETETAETDDSSAEKADVEVKAIEFEDAKLKGGLPDGEVVGGFGFVDEQGDNYVAFSKEDVEREGEPNPLVLHVRHVIKDGDTYNEVRAYREVIENCEFDVILEPKFGDWSVTDLDTDGIGEASFAYTADCASDISPNKHKVFVTEGGEKYVLRGVTSVDISAGSDNESEIVGGDYKADDMPEPFMEQAKMIWEETSVGLRME